jgi:cell division protease FtsH
MVGRWGMSKNVGLVSVLPGSADEILLHPSGAMSEATRQLVDSEVRRIIDECYDTALALLNENRSRLETLATTLLERETLDEADAYEAAGFPATPAGARDRWIPH